MGVDYKVRALYEEQIKSVATLENWRNVMRLTGQLYRYEFDNILMVHAQKPKASLVADYDTWKKVGRYVMRGSKGIAIFPSRALKPYMRYVFDISDTGGRDKELTWHLDEDNIRDYLDSNYNLKITLDDLAERYYLNKYYLSKSFKSQYGVSINNYLLSVRITKAKQMLRFTDLPIEAIGLECGLGSAHYFSSKFKEVEGVSPSVYREQW